MIQERFTDYIQTHHLFEPDDKILLGVSGGVDSVVMMHLFLRAGYQVALAHCNYQLRGDESDQDHLFVRDLAQEHALPFYEKRFDTKDYARDHGLSVQMAARRLRYQWFEQVRSREGYDRVAIGHNKDDLSETFLINLSRGTGLKGLTGIQARRGNVVRPLLFADKNEILHYCREQGLHYREDSSNQTTQYNRNKIRHQIIPVFQQINPRFLDTITENIERLQDAYDIYRLFVEEKKQELMRQKGSDVYISKQVKAAGAYPTLLFEMLREYGFTGQMAKRIAAGMEGIPGKAYYSDTHKLIRDRNWLIVTPLSTPGQERYYLEDVPGKVDAPLSLQMRRIEHAENYQIPRHPDIASVDYDKVGFPLILRRWKEGDYFRPLGLNHFKKLSDFFVDRKYSRLEKERVWLLTSGEKIVWVVGDRLDDRFKIDAQTQRILEITYLREEN